MVTVTYRPTSRRPCAPCWKGLPKIRDSQLYHLSRQRIRLLNGQVEYAYRYTISNAYKARLSPRAAMYDGTLQPRSW